MKRIKNNPVLALAIFMTIFAVLPILAPLFAYLNLRFLSDPIYWIYQWVCHQRPWRSYHMFDYQFAVDARDLFIFLSLAIGAYFVHFKKVKPTKFIYALIIGGLFTLPLAIDGFVQMFGEINSVGGSLPFYESTNLIRSLTGALLGTGVAFAFFPYLNSSKNQILELSKAWTYFLRSLLITILIIPVIVFLWSITSTKYKPSSLFIDNIQRYPGYNYEITYEGGHSTINRVFILPINNYIMRAEKYNKQDLIKSNY